jgi:hypothetical protein
MFNEWDRKDFRSAEKITTVGRNKGKTCFGPWITSPLEARRNLIVQIWENCNPTLPSVEKNSLLKQLKTFFDNVKILTCALHSSHSKLVVENTKFSLILCARWPYFVKTVTLKFC